jgi:Uncharacterized conserved protein
MNTRSGTWRTNLSGEAAYKSFLPAPLPPNPPIELDARTIELLVSANNKVALLDGLSSRIPNIHLFISMYVRKEALMSSQIEGTQATLEDILDPAIEENTNRNVADVVNYIKATEFAISRLKDLPLCCRLIKEIHAVLMEDVRGQEKSPGEFRWSQNWIGGQGSSLKNARYIPPAPDDMKDAMSDMENFMNDDDGNLDALIQAALIHYQFETIHPFLDGNGRIGRLLITLFLMEKGILNVPALYISYFLKKNRTEYYDRMMSVREGGNYEQWITFFLNAVHDCAEDAIDAIDKLTALHEKNTAVIGSMGRASKTAMAVFEYFEKNPIAEVKKTADSLSLSYNAVSGAITRLCDAGILIQTVGHRRNRNFSYEAYFEILRNGT